MKSKYTLILLFTLLFSSLALSASSISSGTKVYYFYGAGCPHCANVEASGVLERVEALGINVERYQANHNADNAKLFNDFFDKFGVEKYKRGVPLAVIECNGNYTYLSGDKPIIDNLEAKCQNFQPIEGNTSSANPNKDLRTIIAVVSASLADGIINPCAMGVLAFLLIILASIGSKKRMIKLVFVYIATIYVVYFFSGIGLFTAFQSFKITSLIYKISALVLILTGLINIKDYFWHGKGLSLAIPAGKKPLIEKYVHKASIPAAVVLGFLVALFELPCTGAWYLSILGLLANSMTRTQAIPLLLLYNLIFVLPLIVISFIVIQGFPPEKIQGWSEKNKKIFRFIMGLIMLVLGVLMLIPGIF